MGAAKVCVEDLLYAMEAEDTAKIVKERTPRIGTVQDKNLRHTFTVTISRGQNLLGRAQHKGADAFVVVNDRELGERLIKTSTVLGAEDPKWCVDSITLLNAREQSFDITVGTLKRLKLIVWDRQLVGKHDLIGSADVALNPKSFGESSTRDLLVPLQPRGMVYLRVSMDGGEKHDIAYHLGGATRALDRAAGDMVREIVDRMAEFIKTQLSNATLQALTKPLRDKKKVRTVLTDGELEGSLGALFEYLDANVRRHS